MLKKLSENILDVAAGLFQVWQRNSVQVVKIEAAKYYLKTVQAVRRQTLWLAFALLSLFLLAVTLIVMPAVMVLASSLEAQVKFKFVAALALLDVAVPVIFLKKLFSQKNWMHFTHSDEIVADAIREN